MSWGEVARAVGRAALLAAFVVSLLVIVAILFSGPSIRERQETNQNVHLLVTEARLNRELVCLAVLGNTNNPARGIPRVIHLCAEVGVMP